MKNFLFLIVFLTSFSARSQQRFYFVAFRDKPGNKERLYNPASYISSRAIERRTRNKVPLNVNDLPPDSTYLATVSQYPLVMYGNSRWFNGCIVLSDYKNIADTLKKLSFVSDVTYLGVSYSMDEDNSASENSIETQLNILQQNFDKKQKQDTILLGRSFTQINQLRDDKLLNKGIGGKGVLIAVLDAGYKNADKITAFNHLIKEKRILTTYDFVEKEEEVFDDDDHGLAVLSCLAAKQPGVIYGTAPFANYILLRTENAASEFLVEEYFWALAAEYADSAGADIINSSLGYSKHDEKIMGHKYRDLDGNTTIVTQAAEIAASKGILVMVSAGNEGDNPWRQLCAPADGEHVLTVGAVDKYGNYAGFSSVGPTADRRQKPDIAALGKGTTLLSRDGKLFEGNGTSYSCPLVTGCAAQLLESAPNTPADKLKDILMMSCPVYYKPDKFTGSGIPDMELAMAMVNARMDTLLDIRELADQNLHVVFFSRGNQKITLTIKEPVEGETEKMNISLKKGLNRMVLKGYKKRPGGLYHLSVEFAARRQETDFIKP